MKLSIQTPFATPKASGNAANRPASSAQATQAPSALHKRQAVSLDANDYQVSTRDDGAVLAVGTGTSVGGGKFSTAITLIPPTTQTENVKTVTVSAPKAFGTPVFRITPYTFSTTDGDFLAYGNASAPVTSFGEKTLFPVAASLRFENDFISGDSGGRDGAGDIVAYKLRAVDSVVDLYSDPMPLSAVHGLWQSFPSMTFPGASTTTLPSASASATSSVAPKLSEAQMIGIGVGSAVGLALGLGVATAALYRKAQVAKRAARTQQFELGVMPRLNVEAFTPNNR